MRSSISMWQKQPIDLWSFFPDDEFTVVAMDQRNATLESPAPLSATSPATWTTYNEDQLAVVDAAVGNGVPFSIAGSCIGPSYALRLMRDVPSRVKRALLLQPIGVAAYTNEPCAPWTGMNTDATTHWFGDWAKEMEASNRASRTELDALYTSLFSSAVEGRREDDPFVFSVLRDDVRSLTQPMLVAAGIDVFHPSQTARDVASLAPNATLVEGWRGNNDEIQRMQERIKTFFEIEKNS